MRESLESISGNRQETAVRREEYTHLLKRLMLAMKSNYLELQQANVVAGSYVEFVQKVVTYLQQYTVDICPVDRFFTDSAAFPLPATDPTYVVGRLKNYELKLSTPAVHKQLASFIQSVSIRAAIDDQQGYLSLQLADAMTSAFENSTEESPSLRAFSTKAIFPAYVSRAFDATTRTAGWILARPVLEASRAMFEELLQHFDGMNEASVASVASILDQFWDAARQAVLPLVDNPSLLERSHLLHVLRLLIETVTATLQMTDYIHRSSDGERVRRAIVCARFFQRFIRFTRAFLENGSTLIVSPHTTAVSGITGSRSTQESYQQVDCHPSDTRVVEKSQDPYIEAKEFCQRELQDSLEKNWTVTQPTVVNNNNNHNNNNQEVPDREMTREREYYFHRGTTRRKVNVSGFLKTWDEEKSGVMEAGRRFEGACEGIGMGLDGSERGKERRVGTRSQGIREGWLS